MFKPILGAAAVASLVATPVMAASNAPLSGASVARSGASVEDESSFVGGGPILALAMLAGVIAGAVLLVVDDNDDQPVSP